MPERVIKNVSRLGMVALIAFSLLEMLMVTFTAQSSPERQSPGWTESLNSPDRAYGIFCVLRFLHE